MYRFSIRLCGTSAVHGVTPPSTKQSVQKKFGSCEVNTKEARDDETNNGAFAKDLHKDKVCDLFLSRLPANGSMVWIRFNSTFPSVCRGYVAV